MRLISSSRTVHWLVAAVSLAVVFSTAMEAGATYRLAVLSDRTGGHHGGVYPSIIREIELLQPDIVVTVGDHIEGYGDDMELMTAEWDTVFAMLDELEVPVYLTPGNHDIWSDDSEELYRRRTTFDPYYSFDYGGTHFIILDTSRAESWEQVEEEQLAWLASDLDATVPEDQIFVFCHKPLWRMTVGSGEADPVHELLVEHGVDCVFTGHYHNFFSGTYDGILYTSVGSSGGVIPRPETEPVARGEFFQFCWVTVHEDDVDLAIIDAGNVYPVDFHTLDDEGEIATIESNYVFGSPVRVSGAAREAADVIVTVENHGPVVIDDAITWNMPEGWEIAPTAAPVVVEPGETGEFAFSVLPPDSVFPAPSLALTYPMSNGMELVTDIPLRVVRTARAARFRTAPVIDGTLDEDCWASATPVTRLYPAYEDSDIDGGTEFRFGFDDRNLYVSAVCHEPMVSEITAANEERDSAVYRDDCVGLFLQPAADEMVVSQIYCNPLGAVFDQRIEFNDAMVYTTDLTWDGEYDTAARVGEDQWVVEAAIPLSELGVAAADAGVWHANFRRKQQRVQGVEDWQIPIDYDPNTFGELVLE